MLKPMLTLPTAPPDWQPADLQTLNWELVPALTPFLVWDGSIAARWQTRVQICANAQALFVHFACEDADIWGTYTQRDDPIYDEEVVEFFIGAGEDTPTDYFEFEISPNGVLFDARVHNTLAADGHRAPNMQVDAAWNCEGVHWFAERNEAGAAAARQGDWHAAIALPWQSLLPDGSTTPPTIWRANFYRIERPQGGEAEFSAWAPPLGQHPDFHRAGQFGKMKMEGSESSVDSSQ